MSEPIAWMNGRLISASKAAVPVTDLGVVAGATVTEMIRTFGHVPFRLDDHLSRLSHSLTICDFPDQISDCDSATLRDAVSSVVSHNVQLIPAGHELGIIIFVTAGQNLTYLGAAGLDQVMQGTVCVHTFEIPFELWAGKLTEGQHLATVGISPLPDSAVPPQAKHRNRLHWFRADQQARSRFSGASALLKTADGHVTETSAGNVMAVSGSTIRTPPSESVLGGISRMVVQELAGKLGLEWREEALTVDQILQADEVLTSSTGYCLLPVTKLNGGLIGNGAPGPVFGKLLAAWSDLVGVDIVSQTISVARKRTE